MFSRSFSFLQEARPVKSYCYTVFDPLQFLARYITRGLGWDEEFPDDLKWTSHQWAKHLPEAPRVKIPRCYRLHKEAMENVSLHTFFDASRLAYAPISYARYGHVSGRISVALVTFKARVSPIKSVSIPRFALMAAVLGLRLAKTVSEKLKILPSQHTLWTDSMAIIYWIQGHSRRLKPFNLLLIEQPKFNRNRAQLSGDMHQENKTLRTTQQKIGT